MTVYLHPETILQMRSLCIRENSQLRRLYGSHVECSSMDTCQLQLRTAKDYKYFHFLPSLWSAQLVNCAAAYFCSDPFVPLLTVQGNLLVVFFLVRALFSGLLVVGKRWLGDDSLWAAASRIPPKVPPSPGDCLIRKIRRCMEAPCESGQGATFDAWPLGIGSWSVPQSRPTWFNTRQIIMLIIWLGLTLHRSWGRVWRRHVWLCPK